MGMYFNSAYPFYFYIMTQERKQILLTPITELVRALYTEDIPTIIRLLDEVRIDSSYFSDITNYVKELLIDDIKTHLECCTRNRTLRVDRKNIYHSDAFDVYTIKDGVLCRAGIDARWTSIGKLYQAYKFIHKIE